MGRYGGAWCARRSVRNTWLQFDFGGRTRVTRVCTQGRQNADQWVTSYYVKYSKGGQRFIPYREGRRTKVECSRFRSLLDLMARDCQPFYQSIVDHLLLLPYYKGYFQCQLYFKYFLTDETFGHFPSLIYFLVGFLFRYLLVITTDIS